jgi:hypothetical protein
MQIFRYLGQNVSRKDRKVFLRIVPACGRQAQRNNNWLFALPARPVRRVCDSLCELRVNPAELNVVKFSFYCNSVFYNFLIT